MEQEPEIKHPILVIRFSTHTMPVFEQKKNDEYILYGKDNNYPEFLLNLYRHSAKHSAIVDGKTDYILGNGFEVTGRGISATSRAIATEKMRVVNKEGEGWDDIWRKALSDYLIFGAYAIKCTWAKNKKSIAELHHIEWEKLRQNEAGDRWFFSDEWTKNGRPNPRVRDGESWKEYDILDPNSAKGSQLFVFKSYAPGMDFYPLPEYFATIAYIEIDREIASFHLNNIKNQFTASHIINIPTGKPPTEREKKKIEEDIRAKFSGSEGAGKFVLNFSQDSENAANVVTLTASDLDKQFDLLNKTVQQEIFTGHRVSSPMLFGVKTEGQLGGRTEIIEANELFQNIYVNKQQRIVERAANHLWQFFGETGIVLKLKDSTPIGLDIVNSKAWDVMTVTERREAVGLPATPMVSTTVTASTNFKKNFILADRFLDVAEKFDMTGYKVIGEFELEDGVSLKDQEDRFFAQKFIEAEGRVSALKRSIIDLLMGDKLMPPEEMAKVLKTGTTEVNTALNELIEDGLIREGEKKSGDDKIPRYTVTPKAKDIVKADPSKAADIFVRYFYAWRAGFDESDLNTSRDFCVKLIEATNGGKTWTREMIEKLSAEEGRNVWETRGGWYTLPGTDTHRPSCRHIWKGRVITKE